MKKVLILIFLFGTILGCKNEASEKSIYALLVSKEGNIIQEDYFKGKQESDLLNVQSVTKSILSLVLGIAIDQGYIANEDILIHDFFYLEDDFKRASQKGISIKHLLNHTSGLEWKGYQEHEPFLNSASPTEFLMDKDMVAKPGELYNYNSAGTHLISIIIEKATGQSCLEFAKEHLFDLLDCGQVKWDKLNDGHCDGAGFGLSMLPKDLMKIGQLIANNGKLDQKQIIPIGWLNKMKDDKLKKESKWGLRNSKHGYGWYSKAIDGKQIIYAMGYGGQFLFVQPSTALVIVALHNYDTPNGIEQQIDFLSGTFPKLLKD